MSCFFCESFNHLSQFCDIHVTDDSRKSIAVEKNCCKYCLNSVSSNQKRCFTCKNQKCYICFSKKHHTVFCPNRDIALQPFLPNIDINLFQRLLQTFEPLEQLFFGIFDPTALKMPKFKELKIFEKSRISIYCLDSKSTLKIDASCINVVIDADAQSLTNTFLCHKDAYIIFKMPEVDLTSMTLSPENFFQCLSPSTKNLKGESLNLTSKITLNDILQRLPNAEAINLCDTSNIEIENSWPKDLLLCKNLEKITFCLNNIDFSVEELHKLLKEQTKIKIFLKIGSPKSCHILKEKLSTHFKFFDDNICIRNPPYLKVTVVEGSRKTWTSNSYQNYGRFIPT